MGTSGCVIIHLIIFLHNTDWCQSIKMCTLYSQWYRPISLNWDKFQFRCCQGSDSAQIKSFPTITNTLNISIFLTQWQLNSNVVFKSSSETFRFIPQQTSYLIVDLTEVEFAVIPVWSDLIINIVSTLSLHVDPTGIYLMFDVAKRC